MDAYIATIIALIFIIVGVCAAQSWRIAAMLRGGPLDGANVFDGCTI
jgi:hypothetical protein